jgi:diguanylate cyclase (GGDEF)-like protein
MPLDPAPRLAHRAEETLDVLLEAVQELSKSRTVGDVQTVVRTAARRLVDADGATFILRDGEECYYADEDAISPLWKGQRFPLDACISGWAIRNASSVAIVDIYADDRVPQDAYRPTFVKSLVMTPIRSSDPLGAIGMYWADMHRATPEEVAVARALADSTAVALEHVQLLSELDRTTQLSRTDPLTDLPNRRAWDQALAQEIANRTPRLCVAVIDLDNFKTYNDENGHLAGDALLRDAGLAWLNQLRSQDLVARLGGEEFAVLLPGCSRPAAMRIADRLRGAVADEVTVSLGLAEWDRNEDADSLLGRADRALYEAKRSGRDRVIWSA